MLEGQFSRFSVLPRDIDLLDKYCNMGQPGWVDRTGKLKWSGTDIVINFGKKKGESLRTLVRDDPNFIKWMLKSDFPRDVHEILKNAAENRWPDPPAAGK